jgi:hypothetical protein
VEQASGHRAACRHLSVREQTSVPGRHKGGVIGLEKGRPGSQPGLTIQNSLAGLGILKKLPFLPSNALRPERIMADRCFMLPEDGTTGVVTLLRPTKENRV